MNNIEYYQAFLLSIEHRGTNTLSTIVNVFLKLVGVLFLIIYPLLMFGALIISGRGDIYTIYAFIGVTLIVHFLLYMIISYFDCCLTSIWYKTMLIQTLIIMSIIGKIGHNSFSSFLSNSIILNIMSLYMICAVPLTILSLLIYKFDARYTR